MKIIPFRIKASDEPDNFSDVYAFLVQGSKKEAYEVEIDIDSLNDLGITDTRCTCPHYAFRQASCKHIKKCVEILTEFGIKTDTINKAKCEVSEYMNPKNKLGFDPKLIYSESVYSHLLNRLTLTKKRIQLNEKWREKMDVYLNFNKDILEKSLKEAELRAIERDGEEEGKGNALYEDATLDIEEGPSYSIETDSIDFSGTLKDGNSDLGYVSMNLKMDFDDIISLIEVYRKRLGKLKTVLEATKD